MSTTAEQLKQLTEQKYKYGFVTEIEEDKVPRGLSEEIVRLISAKKGEPAFMLEWRLAAYRRWLEMEEPAWANVHHPRIDYQDIVYYSAPKRREQPGSMEEVDPELKRAFQKLGIPLEEQMRLAGVAVDAVFDSVSVATTYKKKLAELGIVFCSFSEAVREHPALVERHLGSVVPSTDNYFAALNSAVFSDGSFFHVPKGVRCPMEFSTYFRINAKDTGQFERTLIVAEEGSYVHYVEGCTAPVYASDSLHSAVVEIFVKKGARVRYTTIQNWSYNVYNLVTKRAAAYEDAIMEWVDGNLGSKLTMKYPSIYLMEPGARGEVLSVAFAGKGQHQDAGGKCVHVAPNTSSTIVSKSISRDGGRTSYRGLLKVYPGATGVKSFVRCDALMIGDDSRSDTYPTMEVDEEDVTIGHEATVSKVGDEQLFYLMSRGLTETEATTLIVNGFIEPIVKELPMEYAVELNRLIQLQMAGSIG